MRWPMRRGSILITYIPETAERSREMAVVGAIMVPHPPLIVPEVGKGGEKQIATTLKAYREAAAFIAELRPETLIISSPHSVMYSDWFHISPGNGARGSFSQFRAPNTAFAVRYDSELAEAISASAGKAGIPAGTAGERDPYLDHGTMVPLYFLREAFGERLPKIVRIGLSGLPLREHYRLGMLIAEACDSLGRRAAFIGSGDLSHKLQSYGPYGFAEEGPVYDERIMDVMGRAAFGELFDFDEAFCDKAAECGHRSFVMLAGALDGKAVEAHKLSHEGVTGVGYGICTYLPVSEDPGRRFLEVYDKKLDNKISGQREAEDEYVKLARTSLEYYYRYRTPMVLPEDAPSAMRDTKAGVFVSLHEFGRLRGCIGTILPVTVCTGEEIIRNAISAAMHDPRFSPVREDELKTLEYSVDVLSEPEDIGSESELDPKKYGVIVTKGGRRGLLLPDLDGVDTVSQQISIAKQKAGIGKWENVKLSRFTVTRHK